MSDSEGADMANVKLRKMRELEKQQVGDQEFKRSVVCSVLLKHVCLRLPAVGYKLIRNFVSKFPAIRPAAVL